MDNKTIVCAALYAYEASSCMCNIRQNVSSGEGCFANDAISSHSTPKNVASGWYGIGHRGECKVTRGIDVWNEWYTDGVYYRCVPTW